MTRYKVIKMDIDIAAEEVNSYKNFELLLKAHKKALRNKILLISLLPTSIIIGAFLFFYYPTFIKSKPPIMYDVSHNKLATVDSTQETTGVDSVIKVDASKQHKKNIYKKKPKTQKEIKPEIKQEYYVIKATPKFGLDSVVNYLNNELNTKSFKQTKGELVIAFIIDSEGKPNSINIIQGLSKEIDSEIIKLIREMPAWNPALINGKSTSSTITLPFVIEIKSSYQ